MEKENILFWKITRDRLIAAVFVLFILFIPVMTIIKDIFPSGADDQVQTGEAVLQGNGTIQEEAVAENEEGKETSDEETEADGEQTATDGSELQTQAEQIPRFLRLQNNINDFTQGLYLRKNLISFNTNLTAYITGNSYIESTQVLLGKDNWLFYKTETDGTPIWDYMGINHFTQEELAAMAGNLTRMRDYFAAAGIEFIVMGIPNKENVYPEYMPGTVPKVDKQSRADQVAEFLWANTDIDYIYPMEALLKEKEQYQIYYKTDTHWNQIGAFVGLQAMFSQLYGTYAEPGSVNFVETGYDYAGDLASIAGITDDYAIDTLYAYDESSVDPAQYRDEKLLIIGDSFSGFLSVVAKPYYQDVKRVTTVEFTMSVMEEYQPDVIIWESVERYINYFKDVDLLSR